MPLIFKINVEMRKICQKICNQRVKAIKDKTAEIWSTYVANITIKVAIFTRRKFPDCVTKSLRKVAIFMI